MTNNKNFEKILEKTIENIKINNEKPSLLLHVCCGPCLTIPFEILKDYFKITLIFNNSNIYPKEEHDRRFKELEKYLKDISADITIHYLDYNNEKFNSFLEPRKDDNEGHERCRICFRHRLEDGFKFAQMNHFDYFGTVMTISRYKNAQDINNIGLELEKKYAPVKWLCADFKKNNGYEKSLIIIKDHKMYFQEYCGCKYSYQKFIAKKSNS